MVLFRSSLLTMRRPVFLRYFCLILIICGQIASIVGQNECFIRMDEVDGFITDVRRLYCHETNSPQTIVFPCHQPSQPLCERFGQSFVNYIDLTIRITDPAGNCATYNRCKSSVLPTPHRIRIRCE